MHDPEKYRGKQDSKGGTVFFQSSHHKAPVYQFLYHRSDNTYIQKHGQSGGGFCSRLHGTFHGVAKKLKNAFRSKRRNGGQKLDHHKQSQESQENRRSYFFLGFKNFPAGKRFSLPQKVKYQADQYTGDAGKAGRTQVFHKAGFRPGCGFQIRKLEKKSYCLKDHNKEYHSKQDQIVKEHSSCNLSCFFFYHFFPAFFVCICQI